LKSIVLFSYSKSMEKERQSNVKYKRLNVQITTSKKVSRLICKPIYYWRGSIY